LKQERKDANEAKTLAEANAMEIAKSALGKK
jgi:hypothetical protein